MFHVALGEDPTPMRFMFYSTVDLQAEVVLLDKCSGLGYTVGPEI